MDERVKFVAAMLEAEESFLELCERFGISRKQGYKWKERYELGGVEALADRSRAPHSHPHAVSADVAELVVAARRKHPTWGPRKLLVLLGRHHPRVQLPAASTVGDILRKRGLATCSAARRCHDHCPNPCSEPSSGLFVSTGCRMRFEPTTARLSLRSLPVDCRDLLFGGFALELGLNASCPDVQTRTGGTSACTERSRLKPLARPNEV